MISYKLQRLSSLLLVLPLIPTVFSACTYSSGAWDNDCRSKYNYLSHEDCTTNTCTEVTTSGFLYTCNETPVCTLVTKYGYYVQDSDIYQCKPKSGGGTECSTFTPTEVDACTDNAGKIIKATSGGALSFCMDSNTAKLLSDGGQHIFSYLENNVFGLTTGQKAIITITASTVTIDNYSLPTCTGCNSACKILSTENLKANSFCIQDDKIYKGSDSSTGAGAVIYGGNKYDEGIKVFDITDPDAITEVTPGSGNLSGKLLVMYDCAYGKCIQTFGFVHDASKVYQVSSTATKDNGSGVSECNSNNVGRVKYSSGYQVCALKEITVNSATPTPTYSFASVATASANNYFVIKPAATPATGTFVDYSYYNLGLIKAESNTIGLAMRSLRLPECDTSSCKIITGGTAISGEQSCISSNVIYKMVDTTCTATYGITEGKGVKIFQKKGSFNTYIDVTDTLNSIEVDGPEQTPFFVIYDCTASACTQTSGFVKYKLKNGTAHEFMNCFTEIDGHPAVGCVKLNKDTSTGNEGCNEAKGTSGTYKYTDFNDQGVATFETCFSPKIGVSTTNFRYMKMNFIKGKVGYVFFTNGDTQFPNTAINNNVMVKTNDYSAVLVTEAVASGDYYANSGSVYLKDSNKGKDALITCTGTTKFSECSVVDISSKDGYEINSGSDNDKYPLIYCTNKSCSTIEAETGYYLKANVDNNKVVGCVRGGACQLIAKVDTCTENIGKVLYSDPKYYVCTSATDSEALEISTKSTIQVSTTIGSVQSGNFPSITSQSTIKVKVGKNGNAVLLEDIDGLPPCKAESIDPNAATGCRNNNGDSLVKSCIHTDNKIYITSGNKCNVITGTSVSDVAFFDDTGAKVDAPSESSSTLRAYRCKFTKSAQNGKFETPVCEVARGYIISTKTVTHCSGWKGYGCTVEALPTGTSCKGNTVEGKLISATKLCFGEVEYTLPTGSNSRTIGVVFNDLTEIYSSAAGPMLLDVSASQVLVYTPDTGESGNYYNQNYLSNGAKSLVTVSTGNLGSAVFGSPAAGHAIVDSGDSTKRTIIKYNAKNTMYVNEDVTNTIRTTTTYYIDNTQSAAKVIKCYHHPNEDDDGCTSIAPACTDASSKYYIDGINNENIITCSGDSASCSSAKGVYSYIDTSKAGNVISCANDECISASGKLASTSQAYLENNRSTPNSIIKCTTSSSCESDASAITGNNYYLDATDNFKIISCANAGTCSSHYGSSVQGHAYIDTLSTAKNVLTCSSTGCISTPVSSRLTGANKAYYIDAANLANVITCTTSGCTSGAGGASTIYADASDTTGKRMITCASGICFSVTGLTLCSSTSGSGEYCKYKDQSGTDVALDKDHYCISATNSMIYKSVYPNGQSKSCTAQASVELLLEKNESNGHYKEATPGSTKYAVAYSCDAAKCVPYISSFYLGTLTTNKYLYQCDHESNCEPVNFTKIGYYLSGPPATTLDYTSLIKCTSQSPKDCVPEAPATTGYYVDANIKGNVLKCATSKCISERGKTDPAMVYIDPHETSTKKLSVISCEDDGCTSNDVCTGLTGSLHFVNADGTKQLITCTSGDGCLSTSPIAAARVVDSSNSNNSITCINDDRCYSEPECRVSTGVNCKDKTYNLVKADVGTGALDTNYLLETTDSSYGLLYYCSKNSTTDKVECSAIKDNGYFINPDNTVYLCHTVSNVFKCKKDTTTLATSCSATNELNYFLHYGNPAFCIKGTPKPTFVLLNSSVYYYIVEITKAADVTNTDVFKIVSADATTFFGLLKVGENSVVMDNNYNYELNQYVYVDPGTSSVIPNHTCPINNSDLVGHSLIVEYECDPSTAVCTTVA